MPDLSLVVRTRLMLASFTSRPPRTGRALHEEMRNERTDALFYALGQLSVDQRKLILEALPALEMLVESLRNRVQ